MSYHRRSKANHDAERAGHYPDEFLSDVQTTSEGYLELQGRLERAGKHLARAVARA